jgi:UDP-3-O-[3-hydroxymyristoyl] glucosamine N-acyltransferase
MIDARFFTNAGPFTLGELADRLGSKLANGAPRDFNVTDLAPLDQARASEVALFADGRYRSAFERTKAGIVVTNGKLVRDPPSTDCHLICVAAPRQAFAELAWLFYPRVDEVLGFYDERTNASLDEASRVADSARIGSGTIIGARTTLARMRSSVPGS